MTSNAATIQVDFRATRRQSYVNVGKGVYKDPRTGNFYERPYINGRQTWRKLASTTIRYAEQEVAENRKNQRLAPKGLAHDPYKRSQSATLAELCDFYLKGGCPKARSNSARAEKPLEEEKRMVATLKDWWGKKAADSVHLEDCRAYFAWRAPKVREGFSGRRTVDRELVTLSNIFRWAMRNSRRTGVTSNPLAHDREKFQEAADVRHCRDFQPASGDELHALARFLFETPVSEVLGWQLLFEAMIGQRTQEVLRLRIDAANEFQAGFVRGRSLFLYRSASSKGTYPFARIHPALDALLEAHRAWLQKRYPTSPWFFPSPINPERTVDKGALTKALTRITAAMNLPGRTSHGFRSFFVNVLRSQGVIDAEIALRIGHKTGGKLIVDVYGEIMDYKIDWMPAEGLPAWSKFARVRPMIQGELLL